MLKYVCAAIFLLITLYAAHGIFCNLDYKTLYLNYALKIFKCWQMHNGISLNNSKGFKQQTKLPGKGTGDFLNSEDFSFPLADQLPSMHNAFTAA